MGEIGTTYLMLPPSPSPLDWGKGAEGLPDRLWLERHTLPGSKSPWLLSSYARGPWSDRCDDGYMDRL